MHKNHFFTAAVWIMVLISCQEKKTIRQSELSRKLDSLITQEHQAERFDGTLVVGTKDSILYEKAIGMADRVWDIPMRSDHRFDICSVTKSFTAALILIAVNEGKLKLNDRLVDLLHTYPYNGSFHPNVTVHHLLTHTSGIPHYEALNNDLSKSKFRAFKRMHPTREVYIDLISKLETRGDPGNQFYYSSFGYHLLTFILEDIYQVPYAQLLDEKVCKPLKLKHTFSTVSNREIHKHMVEAYNYDDNADSWERNQFIDLTLGRRIFSTSRDLYKWGQTMSTSSLLPDKSMELMQTNHLTAVVPDISYGYGLAVFDGEKEYQMGNLGIEKRYIIHGGNTEGFKSMLINIENGEYIIAFLANTGDRTNEMRLAQKIVNILIKSE